jgi:hypothetical protein
MIRDDLYNSEINFKIATDWGRGVDCRATQRVQRLRCRVPSILTTPASAAAVIGLLASDGCGYRRRRPS